MVNDLNFIIAAYELTRQRYAGLGLEVECALEVLSQIPITNTTVNKP
jgi:L-rhamnose isomerase